MPARTTALAVVIVAVGWMLTACGAAGNPYALPKYNPKAPVATGSQAPASPGRPTVHRAATPPPEVKYTPGDAWGEGAWVETGTIVAGSPQARAAVATVTKYLSVRVQLSNTWQVDEPALEAVASGEAVTTAQEWAASQREKGRRSIGRFIINVSSVQLSGSSASVTGCNFDATSEVDQGGNVVIPPPGGVRITMKLQRTGGVWRVTQWPDRPAPFCDWRS